MAQGPISMTPSSISFSGTSATINAQGGVDFDAITSLSVNGVFTATYTNYIVTLNMKIASGTLGSEIQLRAAGSNATGTDYVHQLFYAQNTTIAASRSTGQTKWLFAGASTDYGAEIVYIGGPALADKTTYRSTCLRSDGEASQIDFGGIHNLATAYDGFTLATGSSNYTGSLHVFGLQE